MRGLVLGLLGAVLGAGAVVGASLTFEPSPPTAALSVSSRFCTDALSDVAAGWDLALDPQRSVQGERDELTACEASSPTGEGRLIVTVLAVADEQGRDVAQRSAAALKTSCAALGPAPVDATCRGPVRTAGGVVGSAASFVTSDDRAVVTIVLTASLDRGAATAGDVDRLTRALDDRSVLRG